MNRIHKISFRLWPPYTETIAEKASLARVSANQYARIATMAAADGGLLNLSERLQRISDELIRLRKDVNELRQDFRDAIIVDQGGNAVD
jgi:protoporphyrinogen oxidase